LCVSKNISQTIGALAKSALLWCIKWQVTTDRRSKLYRSLA
jgi:hypothetical protein